MKTNINKLTILFLCVFLVGLTSAALPTCLDSNEQDISNMPCVGFTLVINCSGNVTAYNTTDSSMNFTFTTDSFVNGVYNFTLNLTSGSYELIDCENNTATIFVGLVEQGYGINMFGIMFPAVLLSFISLFVSGKMFKGYSEDDEEREENYQRENDQESFVPRSRLIPIVFMLFSFVPMIFMTGLEGMMRSFVAEKDKL